MPLETGDYISDLVETNPPGTDPVSQGDDHIRLIKHVLKETFPNINGPVTSTDEELSNLGQQMPIVTAYDSAASAQTHTFTPGRNWAKIIVTGGGGGGGGTSNTGGAAGGTAIKVFAITEATATYTVGAGGGISGKGGDSTFAQGANPVITGQGGPAGIAISGDFVPATGVNGDLNISGGGGFRTGNSGSPGQGGVSYWGGSQSSDSGASPTVTVAFGAGGRAQTIDQEAIGGMHGVIYIEEYV
jgi:hypothetical protein